MLRAQLAEAKAFRSDVLQTVNTTLATIGGLALLLVGFSWYANFRVLEREKAAMQVELKNSLAADHAQLRGEFAELIQRQIDRIGAEAKETSAKAIASVASQLAALELRVGSLQQARSQAANWRAYDRLISEAWYWQLKGTPGNELYRYQEALTVALELGDDTAIGAALSNMIRMADSGTLPFWSYVPGITANLDRLPSRFATEKQRMTEVLARVPRS